MYIAYSPAYYDVEAIHTKSQRRTFIKSISKITSDLCGRATKCAHRMSICKRKGVRVTHVDTATFYPIIRLSSTWKLTWYFSTLTSLNCLDFSATRSSQYGMVMEIPEYSSNESHLNTDVMWEQTIALSYPRNILKRAVKYSLVT